MAKNPSPITLLNKRIADVLNSSQREQRGVILEPNWTPTMVQRVLGAASEVILEALTEGEEVQFGRLGRFLPRVLDERVVSQNLGPRSTRPGDGERTTVPRRVKLGFEATSFADKRIGDLARRISDYD